MLVAAYSMLDARKMVNGYQEIRESGSRRTGYQVIREIWDLIEDLDPSTHSILLPPSQKLWRTGRAGSAQDFRFAPVSDFV